MQELNMKIAKTPLGNAIEELDALKEELADVKDRIAKQTQIVCNMMKQTKQYQIVYGKYEYEYFLKEEEETIRRKKV